MPSQSRNLSSVARLLALAILCGPALALAAPVQSKPTTSAKVAPSGATKKTPSKTMPARASSRPEQTGSSGPTPSRKERARAAKITAEQRARAAVLFKKGEKHFFARRFYTARRFFEMTVRLNPEHQKAYAFLGDIFLMQRKLDKAEENIRIALELTRYPARQYFRLGQLYYLRKKPQLALAAFRKARQMLPSLYASDFQLGLVYLVLLRNKKETIKHWTAFRKLAPADPQGPAIDRALALLRDPNFKFSQSPSFPCVTVPKASDSRVPYKKAKAAKKKVNNKTKGVIGIDDL